MTRRASVSQLRSMRVRMTGQAIPPEPEIGVIEALRGNCRSAGNRNSIRVMALRAFQRQVFALERISGLAMVELIRTGRQANQLEMAPGMFRMAARAIHLTARAIDNLRMEAGVFIKAIFDVHMARKTFQSRRARPERMAVRATEHAFQIGVCLRQRP